MLATGILQDLGYRVLEAGGPAEALELAARQNFGDCIQLLLTDAAMPGVPQSELADAIKSSCRGIKILLMSGYTNPAGGQLTLPERGFAWLEKPYTPCTLARAVREILDEE